jgi:hypothetical protein
MGRIGEDVAERIHRDFGAGRAQIRCDIFAATAMKVILGSDYPIDDAACIEATGKTIGEWIDAIDAHGAGRRDAIPWTNTLSG